ncbi:hypothetical protein CXB51_031696 [Gossypium anomalum]|uniref:Reverse transcriptase Ty1/copia-type domain-containing protein n=1 Tax=Gossypium anomalum TaxID=47600 RepID=A0A8J6CP95_9ROSI|nr:hypothetical protein CXB51_031696 [Gossypium anomalum]
METIRLFFSQAAQFKWSIFQMDVKSAFLNGVLKEEVYIEQPPGYMKSGEKKKVLKLKKALYGLKQAPWAWNTRIDTYFKENGFKQCPYEHALYVKKNGGNMLFVALYVDDFIFMGNNGEMIQDFKSKMTQEFEMTDLGLMKFFRGLEVRQEEIGIFVSQEAYAKEILRYLTCTRPDLSLSVGIISRFMEEPVYSHWKALKRILRDWCRDLDDRKSTSGYVFFMGNKAFTWLSKRQPIVTLSTCEAEYVAASCCVCHAIWLRNLLNELEQQQLDATEIRIDNKSAIELAKNPVNHERSKHIDIHFHFIRDHVKEGSVKLVHVASRDQVADIFTKPLSMVLLDNYKKLIGMEDGRSI